MAVTALLLAVWHVAATGYYTGTTLKRWTWIVYISAWAGLVVHIRAFKPWRLSHRPWRVMDVRAERGRAWTITLEPDGHAGFSFQPGQFAWLTLGRSPFAATEHPFSFSSSAEDKPRVSFTIKELGDFTNTIGATTPGTIAYVDGPFGVFTPQRHPGAPGFVLIAGGVGIAPLMSMLRTFADRGEARPVTLIYANNRFDEVLFREELEDLSRRLALRVVHVILEPDPAWPGERGLVDRALLDRALPPERQGLTYFVCGPEPMTDAVQRDLAGTRSAPAPDPSRALRHGLSHTREVHMRKRIAIGLSLLAVGVLVALSVLFAVRQNPADGASVAVAAIADTTTGLAGANNNQEPRQENDSVAGLRVFRAQGCERCHSVQGVGSPRFPLDGVGSRRDRDELRAWTVGAPAVQDSLSPSAVRAKRRYEQIPPADMRVLIAYLWLR
jgi:ferredoxin-NADP reductase